MVSYSQLSSRTQFIVPLVAEPNTCHGTGTQVTQQGAKLSLSKARTLLTKKAALYTDLEPASTLPDIAVALGSGFSEDITSAGRHLEILCHEK